MAGDETKWWGPPAPVQTEAQVELVAEVLEVPLEQARELLAGERLSYLLVERLGKSRFAETWLAVDLGLVRRVVVKLLNEGGYAEARAVTDARHPNVVEIYAFSVHEGRQYAVFAYCEGLTLAEWSQGKPWQVIVERIVEAGRGLQHCHRQSLVHGDVKPANILITQGKAVLADFGLAGKADAHGDFGGTAGFIAPELAYGVRGPKADVYALAVTAWCCLFGAPPYPGKSVHAMMLAATQGEPPEPEKRPRGMPRVIVEVLRAGMRRNPRERPAVEVWLRELVEAAESRRRRVEGWRKARNVAVTMLVALVVGLGGHSMQSACAGELAVPDSEPSMGEAISKAKSGNPFGAYSTWWELNKEDGSPDPKTETPTTLQLVILAEAMLAATEELPDSQRARAARLTKHVATTAGAQATDPDLVLRAGNVRRRAKELILDSPPSRPR